MSAEDKGALLTILTNTPEFKPSEVTVAEELIDNYLALGTESGYHIQIADNEGKIVGYICYGETPLTTDTWDIYWIAVDRTKRGNKIGRALAEAAEVAIRQAHGRMIVLETSSGPLYENTQKFYLNHGYEIIACVPDFYSPGDDKLILQKRLE
jgi:ribosomal protein S18 acetylase RimI-like enzyme